MSSNFRRHKKNPAVQSSLDGFVSGSKAATADTARAKLGNFRQADGFHAVRKGRIGFDGLTPHEKKNSLGRRFAGRQPRRDDQGGIQLSEVPLDKSARKRHIPWAKVAKRGGLALLVLLIFSGGFLFVNGYLKARQVLGGGGGAAALEENVDPNKLRGEGDGRVNILLLGKGGEGHTAPDLTDTILIASIDPIHKEAALLSIPRDLYVKTPNAGSMKVNAVYASAKNKVLVGPRSSDQAKRAEEAGINAIEETIESNIGIPIHYHGMVDFTGFKKAIDAVGGIDINVTDSLYEVMRIEGQNYVLNVKPGRQHFDGFKALAYARSRMTSRRGDFDRAERQRLMLVGLKERVFSLGTLSNPLKVNELINAIGSHISTNLSLNELMRLYDIGKQIDSSKVESIGLADPPNNYVKTASIGGQSVVIPRAGVGNFKEIQAFVRNKLRDGFLRKENASIAVYNGTTTTGLAARTAEDLKSYGYNITAVADAPNKGNKTTILVDLTGGQKKYTQHYLEQRLSVTAIGKLPDGITVEAGTADFVIILGTDEVTRLQN